MTYFLAWKQINKEPLHPFFRVFLVFPIFLCYVVAPLGTQKLKCANVQMRFD